MVLGMRPRPTLDDVTRRANTALNLLALIGNRECLVTPGVGCGDADATVELSDRCVVCVVRSFVGSDEVTRVEMVGWLTAIHAHDHVNLARANRVLSTQLQASMVTERDAVAQSEECQVRAVELEAALGVVSARLGRAEHRVELTRDAGRLWDEADELRGDRWMAPLLGESPLPVRVWADRVLGPGFDGDRLAEVARLVRRVVPGVVRDRQVRVSEGLSVGRDWLVEATAQDGRRRAKAVALSDWARHLLTVEGPGVRAAMELPITK